MEALIVLFASGLISLFVGFSKKPLLVLLTGVVGCFTTIGFILLQLKNGQALLELNYKGLGFDQYSLIFGLAIAVLSLLAILIGYQRFNDTAHHIGEYVGLLLISATGAFILASFTDMFMFFLGLEILSIPIYVMAGSRKQDTRSNEASLKYFLMGAFATGIVLFGVAWIYAATRSFDLEIISNAIQSGEADLSLLSIGVLLMLAAFLFKIGAAPFHFWSPDVYEGSPTIVTGFMASVVKIGAFAAFMKIFKIFTFNNDISDLWINAIIVLIMLTLIVGNLSALRQTKFKRLLAYSSITHVGYTLLTIITGQITIQDGALKFSGSSDFHLWFYMFGYGIAVLALIAVASCINDEKDELTAFRGLAKRSPYLATVAIVALISLAGIPPTAGFFGKYLVFTAAWKQYWYLVIFALVNSAISIYYYLKLIVIILSKEENVQTPIRVPVTIVIATTLATLATFLLMFVTKLF